MTKNEAENEDIFVSISTFFALVKTCVKNQGGLLLLGKPEALPASDSSFASARVLLFLGEGIRLDEGCLHLGESEARTLLFFSFASARLFLRLGELIRLSEPEALGASFTFLFFLPSSLLSLFSIFSKLTQMRD